MKKIFITALLVSFTFAHMVNAENHYRPYIGTDVSFNKAKTRFIRPEYAGAIINLGTTYNTYFGTEIFYHQTTSSTKTYTGTKYKTSFRAYGLDAVITLPVYSKFDLNLNVGVGSYLFKEKLLGTHHGSDEGIGYRFGGSGVYHFSNRLAGRLCARYIKFNNISNLKHSAEYTVGARYYFTEN